ncbi:RHS repeat-associated core domain-containing protein [Actinophytocola algeriensis]|uniref:RHS repeat-associated protein n=1 Tax=Actinophytocola algeriensis TaxID=1768010 RepID=A0A7W7VH22_9PSEU|nr:RHS repeat-associated core domain-containing protein [Actinophytocola algeriensis]MBB4910077.1 RHS repeat-associated protein [Actinophytocola algeriensis]MBE1476067.1 RHS repeat-associated protein [Actinophytocola algeriensis]
MAAGAKVATYDERNRLESDGTDTYMYTPRGTLSSKSGSPVAFDGFDRLKQQGAATYTYDALDRVATRNGAQFTYSGATNELATDGTATFGRGPWGELLSVRSGTDQSLTLADQHGDVIAALPTTDRTVSDSTAYDPWGKVTDGTERRIGYQGDYTDPDTDQVNMTARWYDPSSGGFSSRDSAALPTTPSPMGNRYSYGASSPMNYSDPTGRNPRECQDLPGNPYPALCLFPDSGGQIGSGLGGLPSGSSCGGSPLPPDVLAVDCCTGVQAFAPCDWSGADLDFNGGGASGSLTGSINGPRGGGGSAGTPRPDPAIAARQANRAAALNNPLPIPGAMLAPLYGGSITAPVSPAPDVPSRTASDYQDPIDDTNESYRKLENSITVENETLLGSVRDTLAAPAEVQPINYPTDPGDIDDMLGDAYKNAGKCQPFEGTALGDHCTGMAASPNFDNQMGAEMGLLGLEVIAPVGDSLALLLDMLNPAADAAACADGDQAACWWAAAGIFPFGRFGRLLRNIDDVPTGGGGGARGGGGHNPQSGPMRMQTESGEWIDVPQISTRLSMQKQNRHLRGHPSHTRGGYMSSLEDARTILDNFHNGRTTILGKTREGYIVIRDNSVTGHNHNPGAGYPNQETNVFFIKGSDSPSIVPYNPNFGR